jgi:hypothetical protein
VWGIRVNLSSASAFAIFTEDAINKIGQPGVRLTEDSLFLMNNLIRDILKLEEDVDPLSENIRSDYRREFERRLFSYVVKSDISLFATRNGLSPIQSLIEFQMSERARFNREQTLMLLTQAAQNVLPECKLA